MTEVAPRRVLILLLRSPEWTPYATVLRLADAFLSEGCQVTLFLMDDAVLGLWRPMESPGSSLRFFRFFLGGPRWPFASRRQRFVESLRRTFLSEPGSRHRFSWAIWRGPLISFSPL